MHELMQNPWFFFSGAACMFVFQILLFSQSKTPVDDSAIFVVIFFSLLGAVMGHVILALLLVWMSVAFVFSRR
jgi:predicted membrane channel-forming protein YqfA (hemolysin III family)